MEAAEGTAEQLHLRVKMATEPSETEQATAGRSNRTAGKRDTIPARFRYA